MFPCRLIRKPAKRRSRSIRNKKMIGDGAMKYLCLGFHEERTWEAMIESERKALVEESLAYEQLLRKNGHCIDGKALQRAATAATLRFDNGKVSVTDGPFAETKEQLGGVLVLEATDLNHAIQLMSQLPCMRAGGCVEIRPINEELSNRSDRYEIPVADLHERERDERDR